MLLASKQWGVFTTNIYTTGVSKGTIKYLITYKIFGLPFGMLNGYNMASGGSFFTLEQPNLSGCTWVIGTSYGAPVENNRWLAIGV